MHEEPLPTNVETCIQGLPRIEKRHLAEGGPGPADELGEGGLGPGMGSRVDKGPNSGATTETHNLYPYNPKP